MALRRRSLYDRLRAIAEYDYTRRPDTVLVLTPSVWEERLTTRFCERLNLKDSYIAVESRDALERRDLRLWCQTTGLFGSSYHTLDHVSSQGRSDRARHPMGVIARLKPYTSYYWSPEHKDDQPPFPTTLFVVDNEEIEDTYVHTAARMSLMSLPILVSCIPVLSTAGILGRSWRPLWEPESQRLPLSGLSAYQWDWLYHRMRHRPVEGDR